MESVCRRWYLYLGCLLIMNLVYGNVQYLNEVPASLGEIDNQCWEIASFSLVEMKKLKVADTMALWEYMTFLKESPKPKHNDVFNDLAQNFWDMYIDCVLSRSHGMGKRQLPPPESTFMYLEKASKGFTSLKGRANPQAYRRHLGRMTSN